MATKNPIRDLFTVVVWLFEAQYQIASAMVGLPRQQTKMIFNSYWTQLKRLAKHLNISYDELEAEKGLEQSEAADDMYTSGEVIIEFCKKYIEAEKQGNQELFMGYLKNWK